MKERLSERSPRIEIRPGYEGFFAGLVDLAAGRQIDNGLGNEMRSYVQEFLSSCDLNDFQDFSQVNYCRIHLGRHDDTGWEAIMVCWKQGNMTSVHGHPQFAGYNFASGNFQLELFGMNEAGKLELTTTMEAGAGQGFFSVGREGAFDNHIHRITCLSGTGHSLHVYSDDARKGVVFDF